MTTFFCVHGMWGQPYVWDRYKAYFEQAGHRVVTPTLPFHDVAPDDPVPAEVGRASVTDYVDALEAEARALVERPVLVGHSMGGLLVQLLAERGVSTGVVALASAPAANFFVIRPGPLLTFTPTLLTPFFWRRPHRLSYGLAKWAAMQHVEAAEARAFHGRFVSESGRALAEIAFGFLDRKKAAHVTPGKAGVPMLLITGSDDRICPAELAERTAKLQGAAFEEVPGFGHWLLGEAGWERIADRVVVFGDELEG